MEYEDVHVSFKKLLQAFTKQNVDVLLGADVLFSYDDTCNSWQINFAHPLFQFDQLHFLFPPLVEHFLQLLPCKTIPPTQQTPPKVRPLSSVEIEAIIDAVTIALDGAFERFIPGLSADLIASVAGEKYENRASEGLCAVFSSEPLEYSSILSDFYKIDVGNRKTLDFTSIHAHRKFLNISSRGERQDNSRPFQRSLQCMVYERKKEENGNCYELVGFAERKSALVNFPAVLFSSYSQWSFSLPIKKTGTDADGRPYPVAEPQCVATYRDGYYCFPELPLEDLEKKYLEKLLENKLENPTIQFENAYTILQAAKKQKRGALIILSEKEVIQEIAEDAFLSQMGIRMDASEPIDLAKNTKYLDNFSVIDGAVLVDFDGLCHAVGAIIGGHVKKSGEENPIEGDIGRGSRYNSAVSFIDWASKYQNCFVLAIVVSEDGIVDLLPSQYNYQK